LLAGVALKPMRRRWLGEGAVRVVAGAAIPAQP
jgi:hypothetical protein